ncbi:MAG: spore gernimation protein GerA [Epulopiscium sp. Nuni2H_MBin003]|nr:MAG: spore gernimation protein GerA [Epulopiscium sp. Nuni2H_MBin003]
MEITNSIGENLKILKDILPLGKSFDIIQKVIKVHNRTFYLFFIDGFAKDTNLEYVRRDLLGLGQEKLDTIHDAQRLIEVGISSIEVSTETDVDKIVIALLSGQTIILFDGSKSAALVDLRTYPARGVEEPDKEKVLRGAKDGFVETIVFNTTLIRRRIRDPHLTFEMFNVGTISQTDVAIGYMSNKVDKKHLKIVIDKIKNLKVDALTMTDESLIEALSKKCWLNPLPRAKYTERPDVAAAQLMEGKIIIIVDNTPSTMILPVGFLDFTQDVDDFYLPVLTGNYLKLVRSLVLIMNLFLTPVYVLLIDNQEWIPAGINFIIPDVATNVPIYVQFLFLEVAIDALKIASLNTPSSLGTSLSVIGGLILGEYAVKTGWLIPHTILYMAVVALSSFTQPSIEFGYSIKFARSIMLLGAGVFGVTGFVVGIIINIAVLATTKTITGGSYLYPLIPFNGAALKSLLFRKPLVEKQDVKNK